MHAEHKTVKARKSHICLWCKERIKKGEMYIRESYADGDYHGRNAYHLECQEAMRKVDYHEIDWWNDEGCVPNYHRGKTTLAC